MILEGYGIRLVRLAPADLELVRRWRNSTHINRFMVFREEITAVQQVEWFNSINNIHNNYFIVEVEGEKIGLINGAGIDWERNETHSGGIFIWEDRFWQTTIPMAAALLLTDTSVLFGLERTFARVLRDNKNALSFNKMLGYEPLPEQPDEKVLDLVLDVSHYREKRESLRQLFFKGQPDFVTKITMTDPSDDVQKFYIEKIKELDLSMQAEVILIENTSKEL